jgi:hypothetical protein
MTAPFLFEYLQKAQTLLKADGLNGIIGFKEVRDNHVWVVWRSNRSRLTKEIPWAIPLDRLQGAGQGDAHCERLCREVIATWKQTLQGATE